MSLLSMVPGISYAKLIGVFAVGLVIWLAFGMVKSHFDTVKADREALVLAQAAIIEKDATIALKDVEIANAKELARIERQFQDDKIALQEKMQAERQSNLDAQRKAIERMGNAEKMAEVAKINNGYSTGAERLTYRAQARTDEISRSIETKSRHEALYATSPDTPAPGP